MVLAAAPAGCLAEPSPSSAGCLADDDCTACGRCANGACVFDAAAAARPFCVDEVEDPCDGVDTDGNGVIDDPEVCWAPVFAWVDDDGARCFGGSPSEPPEACPGYGREDDAPAFALAARVLRDTVRVRQCSLGSEHVLIADTEAFGPTPQLDPPMLSDAWESLGYACGPVLGRAFTAPPAFGGALTPFGGPCALSRFVATAQGTARWTAWLGGDPGPPGGICEPDSALWVAAPPTTCAVEPPAACAVATCAPRPSGRVLSFSPPDDAVLEPGSYPFSVKLENTGPVPWQQGWCLAREAGPWATVEGFLTHEVAARSDGAGTAASTYTFHGTLDVPLAGLGLSLTWALHPGPCTQLGGPFMRIAFHFDVASPYAASRVDQNPPNGALLPISPSPITFDVTLANTGAVPWPPDLRLTGVLATGATATSLPVAPLYPGEQVALTLTGSVPAEPGRYVDRWSLAGADGVAVPSDGDATLDTVVWAGRLDRHGRVTARSVAAGAVIPPGLRFQQVLALENVGDAPWEIGMKLRHVSGDLARVAQIALKRQVNVGYSWIVALPLQVPANAAKPLRDGWTLYDRDDRVVGLEERLDAGGTATYGAVDGAWLWTEIVPGTPCTVAPDIP